MPIFEYKCKECGTKFQRLVRSGDKDITCAQCGSENVAKLFSTFACAGVGTGHSSSGCSSCSGGSCSGCH